MPSHEQFLGERPELVRYAVPSLHQAPEARIEELCIAVDLCAANPVEHDFVEAAKASFLLSVERGLEVREVVEMELCDGKGSMITPPVPRPVPLHKVPTPAAPLFPLAFARRDRRRLRRWLRRRGRQFDV